MTFWCSKNDGEVLILGGCTLGLNLCELLLDGGNAYELCNLRERAI